MDPKFSLIFILIVSLTLEAQNQEIKNSVAVKIGFSITGAGIKTASKISNINDSLNPSEFSINSNPAFVIAYDHTVNNKISIGLLGSIQGFNGKMSNYGYVNQNDSIIFESITFEINRIFFGIAPKYHWPIDNNNRINIYSGFRVGYIVWSNTVDTSDPNFNVFDSFKIGRPAAAIIPIGVNANLTDVLGANFEVAFGAPYFLSTGIQYTF